jgi:hypothetical protein
MVSETTANGARERTQRTVALDQSALLEVLDALKTAVVDDRIGQAAQTIYQALIEAELTSVIGAAPHQRTPERLGQRNGHRPRVLATTAGIWSCGSQAAGRVVLPLAVGAAPPSRPGPVRGGDGGVPARSQHPQGRRPGPGPLAPTAASARARSAGSAPTWTARWPASGTAPWPDRGSPMSSWTPPLQGQSQPPGRRPSRRDRDRGVQRRPP